MAGGIAGNRLEFGAAVEAGSFGEFIEVVGIVTSAAVEATMLMRVDSASWATVVEVVGSSLARAGKTAAGSIVVAEVKVDRPHFASSFEDLVGVAVAIV